MSDRSDVELSRRERQIMDVVYARGQATAAAVTENLPDPPSYSAVRAMLRILEDKGHLSHRKVGPRYVYLPTRSREKAGRSAIRRVVETFFEGSAAAVMVNLLETGELDEGEIRQLRELLARRSGAK